MSKPAVKDPLQAYCWQSAMRTLLPRLMINGTLPPSLLAAGAPPWEKQHEAAQRSQPTQHTPAQTTQKWPAKHMQREASTVPERVMQGVTSRSSATSRSSIGRTFQQYGVVIQCITEAQHPYRIISVSNGWQALFGYSRGEALGKPFNFAEGFHTEADQVEALLQSMGQHRAASVRVTNYTKSGEPFVHRLSVEPLRDPSGETQCFQATSHVLQYPGEPQGVLDSTQIMGGSGQLPLKPSDSLSAEWPLQSRQTSYQAPERAAPSAHTTASFTCEPSMDVNMSTVDELDDDILSWLQDDKTSCKSELSDALMERVSAASEEVASNRTH